VHGGPLDRHIDGRPRRRLAAGLAFTPARPLVAHHSWGTDPAIGARAGPVGRCPALAQIEPSKPAPHRPSPSPDDCGRCPAARSGRRWGRCRRWSSKVRRHPFEHQLAFDQSPGGAGWVATNRPAPAGLGAIEQAGFAPDIGPATIATLTLQRNSWPWAASAPAPANPCAPLRRAATPLAHRGRAGLPRNHPGPPALGKLVKSCCAGTFELGAVIPLQSGAIEWAAGGCGPVISSLIASAAGKIEAAIRKPLAELARPRPGAPRPPSTSSSTRSTTINPPWAV